MEKEMTHAMAVAMMRWTAKREADKRGLLFLSFVGGFAILGGVGVAYLSGYPQIIYAAVGAVMILLGFTALVIATGEWASVLREASPKDRD